MKTSEKEKGVVEIELGETDLGFATLVAKRLLESKGVSFAAAKLDHPLTGKTILQIKAGDPEAELRKAVSTVKKELAELRAAFKKSR